MRHAPREARLVVSRCMSELAEKCTLGTFETCATGLSRVEEYWAKGHGGDGPHAGM